MKEQKVYEVNNKKYIVISKVAENSNNTDGIYNLVTEYVLEKLNKIKI